VSRAQQIIDSYGGMAGLSRLPRDQQAQIKYQVMDAQRQDALEANQQAEKQAKGNVGQDLAGLGASVGGMYLGSQVLGPSLFGGGGAATGAGAAGAGAATGATVGGSAAGAGAAASTAGVGAVGAAAPGVAAAPGMFAGAGSALLPVAGIAAGGLLAQQSIKGIKDLVNGKKLSWGSKAALALPTFGASLIPFGHGKNYWASKDRAKMLGGLESQFGPQEFTTGSGEKVAIDPKLFEKFRGEYNYDMNSATRDKDIGTANPLAYLLTGEKVGSKKFTDLASTLATISQKGVAAKDLYGKYGLDYSKARTQIEGDKNLDQATKDAFINGLNVNLGNPAQSNQGSPGMRPRKDDNRSRKKSEPNKGENAVAMLNKLWK